MRKTLTAFIMAQAESLFAAPRGPRTLTNSEAVAGRSGHTPPGDACPDCAPGNELIGGSLRPPRPAATESSRSPGYYSSQLQSGQSRRPAGSRRQLPGRGRRERGTLGERPGESAPGAPPGGDGGCAHRSANLRAQSPYSPAPKRIGSLQYSPRF